MSSLGYAGPSWMTVQSKDTSKNVVNNDLEVTLSIKSLARSGLLCALQNRRIGRASCAVSALSDS